MLFACLATFLCVFAGVTGIIMACIDINRFNFGLYLALLSVVGSTVSIAFWMVKPKMCENPKCVQRIIDRFRKSLSSTFGNLPKEHSSRFVACSNERGLISSDGLNRRAVANFRRQLKKKCSLPFENQKLLKTKYGMRRSSTWCNINDWRGSLLKLDKTHKKLSWRDENSINDDLHDLQSFDISKRSTIKQYRNLSECNDHHVEKIAKTSPINLLLPPISLTQAHSLPKVHQCAQFVKASRSLSFIRRFLVHDKKVNDNQSLEINDETRNSSDESASSDCSANFEFRFIPYPLPSEESTIDSWITRSFSSGSNCKYQLLEKLSSSQSLSTLV